VYSYDDLIRRLAAAGPEPHPLSANDLTIVLRHEPRVLAALQLNAEAVAQALELPIGRSDTRLALLLHDAVCSAARAYVLADVLERLAPRARHDELARVAL
jgi:hypothetical protein